MEQELQSQSVFDRPANCRANWTDEERLYRDYQKACDAQSLSGDVLKLLGVITIVLAVPIALIGGLGGFAVAIPSVPAGVAMAAIGSTASSSKKTAALAEFTAWKAIQ